MCLSFLFFLLSLSRCFDLFLSCPAGNSQHIKIQYRLHSEDDAVVYCLWWKSNLLTVWKGRCTVFLSLCLEWCKAAMYSLEGSSWNAASHLVLMLDAHMCQGGGRDKEMRVTERMTIREVTGLNRCRCNTAHNCLLPDLVRVELCRFFFLDNC